MEKNTKREPKYARPACDTLCTPPKVSILTAPLEYAGRDEEATGGTSVLILTTPRSAPCLTEPMSSPTRVSHDPSPGTTNSVNTNHFPKDNDTFAVGMKMSPGLPTYQPQKLLQCATYPRAGENLISWCWTAQHSSASAMSTLLRQRANTTSSICHYPQRKTCDLDPDANQHQDQLKRILTSE